MDALAGKWTCELECMTGFVKTAGAVISCGPNADEPWGKLSGSITCQGIFVVCRKLQHMSRVTGTNAMCSPLSHLVRFLFVLPPIFLNPTWQGYHVVLSSCQILVTRMVTTKTTKLLTRSVCALCVFYVCFVCVRARVCVLLFVRVLYECVFCACFVCSCSVLCVCFVGFFCCFICCVCLVCFVRVLCACVYLVLCVCFLCVSCVLCVCTLCVLYECVLCACFVCACSVLCVFVFFFVFC